MQNCLQNEVKMQENCIESMPNLQMQFERKNPASQLARRGAQNLHFCSDAGLKTPKNE